MSLQKLEFRSVALYQKTIESIDYAEFYKIFRMRNTFNSWYLVTELHMWLLMVRAAAEGGDNDADGHFIRNSIIKGMWMDVRSRLELLTREEGVRSKQANHAIESCNLHFRTTIIMYDEGLLGDDKILANALWLQFLESNNDDLASLDLLVKYVRKTVS